MSKQKLPTILPQKPPAQLPAATSGQLPATSRGPNPIKLLHKFVMAAEELEEHYDALEASISKIEAVTRAPHSVDAQKHLDTANKLLARHDGTYRAMAQRLQADKAVFDPAEAYDDDGEIVESRVWLHLGTLLSGYPNANVGNEESYIGNMVGEVLTVCDSEMALKLARSHLLKTSKFPPTCAEVVGAIKEQQEFWSPKSEAINYCEEAADELRDALKLATEKVAAEKADGEEQRRIGAEKYGGSIFAIGDRVAHGQFGPGTVESVDGNKIVVMFDAVGRKKVVDSFLERAE
jgi:hypothetical protein